MPAKFQANRPSRLGDMALNVGDGFLGFGEIGEIRRTLAMFGGVDGALGWRVGTKTTVLGD